VNARGCLSAEEIGGLIHAEGSPEVQLHLLDCAACRQQVSLVRRLSSAGIDPIREVLQEMDDLLARLMATPRHFWWRVVKEPEFRRADVARFILTRVLDARLRDPRLALDLANAATAIVDALPATEAGAVRFDAWMYTASLLRERARYGDAERALVRAEDASRNASDAELALASIWLARALLSAEPDVWKPAEAEVFLKQAEAVFAARGDRGRIAGVLTARAFLLFRSGDLHASRRLFASLLNVTSVTEHEAHLIALSNLVAVRVELREADSEVEEALQQLIDENRAIGRAVQVARACWMMGRINVVRGRYVEAIQLFRRATEDIADGDASIRIGVDLVEALLLDGRHSDGLLVARELASAAVALDRREPTRRRALTTQVLAYLMEAAQRQAWTPDLVADLGRYIDRITRQRPFDFIPPMPLAAM
jgi:tetratricopeptide (TPR) repeat protein